MQSTPIISSKGSLVTLPEHIANVYQNAVCLHNKAEVEVAIDAMARQIHNVLQNENPLFLVVMVGGLIPAGHLLVRMDFPLEVDYIHATRYTGKTKGGILAWRNKPTTSLKDRTILIVDDILDGGITLTEIINYCYDEGAKRVYTAVLVEKKDVRLTGGLKQADFTGITIDDHFVFGYGMDYKEYLRNAPGIYAVSEEYR